MNLTTTARSISTATLARTAGTGSLQWSLRRRYHRPPVGRRCPLRLELRTQLALASRCHSQPPHTPLHALMIGCILHCPGFPRLRLRSENCSTVRQPQHGTGEPPACLPQPSLRRIYTILRSHVFPRAPESLPTRACMRATWIPGLGRYRHGPEPPDSPLNMSFVLISERFVYPPAISDPCLCVPTAERERSPTSKSQMIHIRKYLNVD